MIGDFLVSSGNARHGPMFLSTTI